MGLAPIEYFDTFEEAEKALPKLENEGWDKDRMIILKEREGNYSVSYD